MLEAIRRICRSKPTPAPVPVKTVTVKSPYPAGHDFMSFRGNPSLVMEAESLFKTAFWGHVLSVLHNSAPTRFSMRNGSNDPSMELGRIRGYYDALDVLSLLSKPTDQQQPIEQDYGSNPRRDTDDHYPDSSFSTNITNYTAGGQD